MKPGFTGHSLGSLGKKVEAAGKIRVFAMVDPWTQWLLKPLHDALMSLLGQITQDGTFDQLSPVKRLLRRQVYPGLFSYDLSAATDRLPLSLQVELLSPILGKQASK